MEEIKVKIETDHTGQVVCWKTDTRRVKNCDVSDDLKRFVYIPLSIHTKIMAMTAKMKSLEWLCYTVIDFRDRAGRVIDIVVPEQEVTSGSVIVTKPLVDERINGTIHRHPGIGTFLSSTDDEYIGGNWLATISVNDNGEYTMKTKETLACGAMILVDGTAQVELPKPRDLDKFVETSIANIKESAPVLPPALPATQMPMVGGYWMKGVWHPFKETPSVDVHWDKVKNKLVFYCANCRQEVERVKAKWLDNLAVCEKCYDIGMDKEAMANAY